MGVPTTLFPESLCTRVLYIREHLTKENSATIFWNTMYSTEIYSKDRKDKKLVVQRFSSSTHQIKPISKVRPHFSGSFPKKITAN